MFVVVRAVTYAARKVRIKKEEVRNGDCPLVRVRQVRAES
jgi:hypothetical protein